MHGSSSDSSESESLSWIVDHMDWVYESDETDPEIIFNSPPDSKDTMGLVGHDDEDTVSDAESAIRNVPVTVDLGVLPDDELNPKEGSFLEVFGGTPAGSKIWISMMIMSTGDVRMMLY